MQAAKATFISDQSEDYNGILEAFGLGWEIDGHYLLVGSSPVAGSRRIYLSVIQSQIPALLEVLLPLFVAENIGFGVVKSKASARLVLNGIVGAEHIGKVIIAFISPERDLASVVSKITKITGEFHGPKIPMKKALGEILYTDYSQGEESIAKPRFKKLQVLQGKYIVLSVLKPDVKGDVLFGIYLKGLLNVRKIVIKEGRHLMISDDMARDMRDRLFWQKEIHGKLHGLINIAQAFDFFEVEGNAYLVMEWIEGKPLGRVVEKICAGRTWQDLLVKEKKSLLMLLFQVVDIIGKVHKKGYVHRDLSRSNFLVTKNNHIYLTDWELAFHLESQYPLPPFGFGTPGFLSPEQNRCAVPTVKEDIYGLGALMLVFFTGLGPSKFNQRDAGAFFSEIHPLIGDVAISALISACTDNDPTKRPTLNDIEEVISKTNRNLIKSN